VKRVLALTSGAPASVLDEVGTAFGVEPANAVVTPLVRQKCVRRA